MNETSFLKCMPVFITFSYLIYSAVQQCTPLRRAMGCVLNKKCAFVFAVLYNNIVSCESNTGNDNRVYFVKFLYTKISVKIPETFLKSCQNYQTKMPFSIAVFRGRGQQTDFPFRCLHHFQNYQNNSCPVDCHVHMWQVSSQVTCSDFCQIRTWLKDLNHICEESALFTTEKFTNNHNLASSTYRESR